MIHIENEKQWFSIYGENEDPYDLNLFDVYINWNLRTNEYSITPRAYDDRNGNGNELEYSNFDSIVLTLCDDAKDQFVEEIKKFINNIQNINTNRDFIVLSKYKYPNYI